MFELLLTSARQEVPVNAERGSSLRSKKKKINNNKKNPVGSVVWMHAKSSLEKNRANKERKKKTLLLCCFRAGLECSADINAPTDGIKELPVQKESHTLKHAKLTIYSKASVNVAAPAAAAAPNLRAVW